MLATACLMASGVISLNTIRCTGILGLSTSNRCHAMASPSRSSSVARSNSEASFMDLRSSVMRAFLSGDTTYTGVKSPSTSTASSAHGRSRYSAGIWARPWGRSRIWPTLAATSYPGPR